jgi:hypothetical protein
MAAVSVVAGIVGPSDDGYLLASLTGYEQPMAEMKSGYDCGPRGNGNPTAAEPE